MTTPVPTTAAGAPDLVLEDLSLRLPAGPGPLATILDIASLHLAGGGVLGLTGPSGSGKSTLLGLLCGLVQPSTGRVSWGGEVVSGRPEAARDAWRRRNVGLVFQDFHLLPGLSALDNVLLPWRFDHWRLPAAARDAALALLARTGIAAPERRAGLLSRGEQQRVALARALVRRPRILLADEPTASLDAENGAGVADLLLAAAAETGATLVVVSHDPALLARLPRVERLVAGRLQAPGAPRDDAGPRPPRELPVKCP